MRGVFIPPKKGVVSKSLAFNVQLYNCDYAQFHSCIFFKITVFQVSTHLGELVVGFLEEALLRALNAKSDVRTGDYVSPESAASQPLALLADTSE